MSELKMKESFKVKIKDEDTGVEKEVQVCVVRPNAEQEIKGQEYFNRAMSRALDSKAPLRKRIFNILKEQGLWSDDTEKEFQTVNKFLAEGEQKLHKAGMKFSEAKQLALEMRKKRREQRKITAVRDELDSNTVEGQADAARFNYFLSVCALYDPEGTPFFKNIEDVTGKANDAAAITIANKFALLRFNVNDDFQQKIAENKFLIKYGLMNKKCQLLNADKHAVDDEGRLIDEDGNWVKYVNGEKRLCDRDGNLIDKDGELIEESGVFLDDEGNPIVEASPSEDTSGEGQVEEGTRRKKDKNAA